VVDTKASLIQIVAEYDKDVVHGATPRSLSTNISQIPWRVSLLARPPLLTSHAIFF
jgi:hypothetical protein